MSHSYKLRPTDLIAAPKATSAFADPPWNPASARASRLTYEEIEKLRTGEHPHDIELEEFVHPPAPIIIITRPQR
jgi:hypothetical protein